MSTSRRRLLGDAAIAILAEHGSRGLTHRAVDREADVPQGTTKNYFPTRESLLVAAAHRLADHHREAVERLHNTTPAGVSAADVSELYPALLYRSVDGDPAQLLAMVELYLEAVRRPGVRAAIGQMAIANAQAAAELHQTAGLPTRVRDAGTLDAYLLGVALSLLALPRDVLARIGLDNAHELGLNIFSAAVPTQPAADYD